MKQARVIAERESDALKSSATNITATAQTWSVGTSRISS